MQKNGKKRSHSGSSSKRQPKRAALDKLQSNLPPVEGRTGVAVRKSSRGGWTDEEDEVLRRAVALHGAKNWKRIAEYFDGRTDVQCLHRWQKVLNPDLKKEPWSKEEDDTIIGLVGQYGTKRWTAIAEHLPGRIGKQCRERWHNHLNPDIKRGEWGREEDVVIVRMHRRFGNQWARMSSVLKGRTDNAIKNHWNSTLRRKAQQGDFDHLPDWNEGDSDAEDYGSGYDDGMSQEFISQDPSACTAASPKGRGGSQGLSASPTRRHMRPAPHSGSTVEEAESGEEPSPEAKDYALAGGPPPEGATRRSARVARRAAWAGGPLVVPDGDALAGLQSPRRGLSLEPGRSRTHAVLASPIARPSAALPLSPPLFKLPAAAAAAARGPPASWGAAASAAAGPAAAAGAAADSAAQHQQTISPPGHEPTLLPPVLPLSASGASTYQQASLPTATTVPAAAAPGVGIGAAGPPSFTPLVETLAGSSPSLQSGPPSRTPFSTSSGGTSQGLLSPGSAAIAAGGLELAAELSGGSGGRRGSLGRVAMTLPGDLPANSGGDAGGPSAAEQQLQHQQPGEVVAALPPGPARLSDAGMLRLCQAVRGANLPVPGGAGGARFGAEHAASQSVATRLRPAGISSAPAVALLGPATASGPSIAAGPGEATATHAAVGGAVTHGAAGTAQKPASAAMHADTWSSLVELGINPSPAHGHLLTQTDTPLYLESARILQAAGSTIETPLMLSLMTGSKVGGSAGVPGSVRTGSMRRPQAELSILQPTGSSVLHAVPEAGPGGAPGSVSMAPSRHSRGAGGCGSSPWTDQQHPSGGSAGTLGVRSHAPSSATPLDGGSGLEGVSPPPATVGGSCRGRRAALGGLSFLLRSPSFLPPNTLLGLQPLSTCPPPGSTEAGTAGIAGAGAVLSGLASHNKARLGSGGGIPPPPRWGEAHDGGRQLAADPQGIAGGAQHPVRPLSSRLSDMFQRLESLDGGQQGQLVPSVLLYAQQPPVEQAAAMRQTKADAAPSKKPSPPPTAAALKAALLQIAMASPQNLDPNPQAGLGGWEGRGVLAGCSGHHLAGLDAEGVISVLDFGGLGTKSGKLRFGAGGPCATPMWHDVLGSEMGAANIAEFLQSEVATASSSKDALGIIQKALNDAASLYAAAEQVARASGFGVVGS